MSKKLKAIKEASISIACLLDEVEEIIDRDKEAEQEYWDLHPEEELKHKMNLKSYFNAKGG